MTTTLTCPRCGASFETKAVTNTRCRHCRKVVQIPRSADSTTVTPSRLDVDTPRPTTEPDLTVPNVAPDGPPLVLVVALGAALVVAIAVAVARQMRRTSTRHALPLVRVKPATSGPRAEQPANPSPSAS